MPRQRKHKYTLNARNADPHALYETSVQQPEVMIGFIEELFETTRNRKPLTLREDFCGTAQLAGLWTLISPKHKAVAIDNDPKVLCWSRKKGVRDLFPRLTLIQNDVMAVNNSADVLLAMNFSSWIYKTGPHMLAYLRHARRCVKPGGLFICDAFGGPGSIIPDVDKRKFPGFHYLWEQRSFNPLTNEIDCRIHFRFPDGSILRDAFTYDWRMWSLPELRELLTHAGFNDIGIYFESDSGFIADINKVALDAWVAYIVALRD